jgi:T5SS/PEP-CTERM-associated repeat protein/autotransporter-associated beta strand protein
MKTAIYGLCALLLSLSPASALSLQWVQWNGATSGDWYNTGSWDYNRIPTTADDVLLYNGNILMSGGNAYSANSYLGNAANNKGSVTVSNGANWTTTTALQIGYLYNSYVEMTINSSTVASNGYAYIGYTANASGKVTLDGNSLFRVKDNLWIGDSGTGTLVLNGGTVQTNNLHLGYSAAGNGTLIIGGDGSGKIVDNSGNAVAIKGWAGTSKVVFDHNGTANFANSILSMGASKTSIEHNGTGTTILSGTSNIKGGITVNDGSLLVNNTVTTGTTVNVSHGLLGGTGVIKGGRVAVASGAHLATSLTLSNGLTLDAGSYLNYIGDGARLVLSAGSLILGGEIIVDFSAVLLDEMLEYVVMDWSGNGSVGSVDVSKFIASGAEGQFKLNGNTLVFQGVSSVPEPSTYFLMGIGLGLIGLLKLRRRHQF